MALFRNSMAQRTATARCLVCLLLPAALVVSGSLQAQQWRIASEKDGIRMETRALPGERFDELRVSTSLKVSPQTVADYLFGKYLEE
jgi:hypothetical protein